MKKISFLLFAWMNFLAHAASQIEMQESLDKSFLIDESIQKKDFCYFSVGCTRSFQEEAVGFGPDIFAGKRHYFKDNHYAMDSGMGVYYFDPLCLFLVYGQASIFYYPSSEGFYFGPGLTIGMASSNADWIKPITPWANLPLTIGYEFGGIDHQSYFIQLQGTPLGTTSLFYGIRF